MVLSLAMDLMRELKLTFTEQVFLQESGFDADTTYDEKVNKEMMRLFSIKKDDAQPVSIVSGLLDWYQKNGDQQEPNLQIVQTDGPADDCPQPQVSDFTFETHTILFPIPIPYPY